MKKFIFIPLLFLCSILSATKYYVATAAGGGSDSNPGTIGSPFLTLIYAETKYNVADTIIVRGGVYNERLYVDGFDGTITSPKILMAYPGETPIIDGTGKEASVGTVGLVYIHDVNYFYMEGFEVINAIGTDGKGTGIYGRGDGIKISHCTVHDCHGTGVFLYAMDVAVTYNLIIEDCLVYNVCLSNDDGIQQEIPVHETWGVGMSIRGGAGTRLVQDCIIRRNVVYDSWGEGISTRFSNNLLIEDNIVHDCYSALLYTRNSHNALFQRNLVYMLADKGISYGVPSRPGGLSQYNEGTDPYVNENNTFVNNIVYGCNRNFDSSTGGTIANNTFVNAVFRSTQTTSKWNIELTGTGNNGVFTNNIIIQDDAVPCIYTGVSDISYSNNLYNKAYDTDAVGTDDIISATGAHFVDSATFDFHLKSSSPAVDAGLTGIIYYDYSNGLRDAAPDIGAYEFNNPEWPPAVMPSVITTSVSPFTRRAVASGNVISDGDGTVLARGICYGASADPDLTGTHTHETGGEGQFSSVISGLSPNTTYHVRAYVTNEVGTSYGSDVSFTTLKQTYLFNGSKPFYHGGKIQIRK